MCMASLELHALKFSPAMWNFGCVFVLLMFSSGKYPRFGKYPTLEKYLGSPPGKNRVHKGRSTHRIEQWESNE